MIQKKKSNITYRFIFIKRKIRLSREDGGFIHNFLRRQAIEQGSLKSLRMVSNPGNEQQMIKFHGGR